MRKYYANYNGYLFSATCRSCLILAIIFLTQGSSFVNGANEDKGSVDLIECGDQELQIKILCNPRWLTRRGTNELTMIMAKNLTREVAVTISKSVERGLFYSDLTPAALQRVYGYKEHFKYAKTRIKRQWVIRVEGHPQENGQRHLLDYFFLEDTYLYRISYRTESYDDYRKYLPVFVQMMRSFGFLNTK